MLVKDGKTDEEAGRYFNQVCTGDLGYDVSEQDKALLAYADKLTRTPSEINLEDIRELKNQGFSELAIHDMAAITGYFAFVNRLADGLGVELEER